MNPRYLIGVDVGGTFTDVFIWDLNQQRVSTAKVPSTRDDQSRGFIDGIAQQVDDFTAIDAVVHGTTVGTNALLERKGAKTGIITTSGFRDVLAMRRRDRPTTWGLWGGFEPLVERRNRLEVDEQVLADGTVSTAVALDQVAQRVQQLLAAGCESVCVFFINGYANNSNERLAVEAVRSLWPNPYVTAATEIVPEIREFERLSTATLNAYLQPVVSSYLDRLEGALDKRHAGDAEVLIVQSNGGLMSVDAAKQYPVRTALSGPAAGVTAARAIAAAAGFHKVITCDMGGTSFDVSLVADGEAALTAQTAVDFGLVIRTPMIEITTIGAGGGSIATVDAGGILQVGPQSAGSDPGPACYGQGNPYPTVTDANLVIGLINAERPIGGKLERLDLNAARSAINTHVAQPLGLSIEQAAGAMLKVANAKMAGAIRLVSIERGHDPTEFTAMPFGGGGALHAGALIQEVGLDSALVPRFPGVTSALGCIVADMRHDRVQTVNRMLSDLDCTALQTDMQALADKLATLLSHSKSPEAGSSEKPFLSIERRFEFDMLYLGQTHTVVVPLDISQQNLSPELISSAFDSAYKAAFGRLLEGIPMRVVNYRVVVTGRRPPFDMTLFAPPQSTSDSLRDCQHGSRQLVLDEQTVDAPVYERLALAAGVVITGPAILEQPDTTIFIDPGLTGRVDDFGNVVIKRDSA